MEVIKSSATLEGAKTAEQISSEEAAKAGTEETAEEKEARETAEAETAKAEEEEKEKRSFDKMQARINEITEDNYKLRQQVNELLEKPKSEKNNEPTEADLRSIIYNTEATEDQKEYAREKLSDIKIAKMKEELKKETATSQKYTQEQVLSAQKALAKYPELDDPKSEMAILGEKIFIRDRLDRFPDGMEIAADRAAREMGSTGPTKAQLQKKLDKENAKKNLSAGGGKVGGTSATAAFEKLREQAIKEGMDSKAWKDWQKQAMEKNLAEARERAKK